MRSSRARTRSGTTSKPSPRSSTRSIAANRPVEFVALQRNGTGIPAARFHAVVGRRLARDVQADEMLHEADLL